MAAELFVVEVAECLATRALCAVAPVQIVAFCGNDGGRGVAHCRVGPGVDLSGVGEHNPFDVGDGVASVLQMGCEFSDEAVVVSEVKSISIASRRDSKYWSPGGQVDYRYRPGM
jgi:hypothetical protein